MFKYFKHLTHVILLYSWLSWNLYSFIPRINWGWLIPNGDVTIQLEIGALIPVVENKTISTNATGLGKFEVDTFWLLCHYLITIIQYLVILPFPQVLCNLLGLTFFNTFPGEVTKKKNTANIESNILTSDSNDDTKFHQFENGNYCYPNGSRSIQEAGKDDSILDAFRMPHLCFRVVTRGLFPELVQNNVRQNLITCNESGLVNFSIEVVTDQDIYLNNNLDDTRIKQLIVPKDYRSSTGALYKARALQYALEPGVSQIKAGDYIVHLDEETIITENVINGIHNFVLDGRYAFGQGLITYYNLDIVNILTTLADSFRVADDMGKLRFQLAAMHRPVFGWKGSFVVTKYEAELDVSYDHGPDGSIAEDCYFSMIALEKGYGFDFILGEMYEKSPFTLLDFIKQRRRWVQGIWLVVHSRKISIRTKFFLIMSHYACLTLPVTTVNIGLNRLFNVPTPLLVHFLGTFCLIITVYMYLFGLVKSYDVKRKSGPILILHLIIQIITFAFNAMIENVAVVWGIFSSKHSFHVVNKDMDSKVILDS